MRRRITVPGEERNNAPYDYGPWRGTQVWPAGLKRLKRGNYGFFANFPGAVLLRSLARNAIMRRIITVPGEERNNAP